MMLKILVGKIWDHLQIINTKGTISEHLGNLISYWMKKKIKMNYLLKAHKKKMKPIRSIKKLIF